MSSRDRQGRTPLDLASTPDMRELLVHPPSDPNATPSKRKYSATANSGESQDTPSTQVVIVMLNELLYRRIGYHVSGFVDLDAINNW